MTETFQISFATCNSDHCGHFVIELHLDHHGAVVKVFRDDLRTIAILPEHPYRFIVRSTTYDSDPIEVAWAAIESIQDLEGGQYYEAQAEPHMYWAHGEFDRPKVGRWDGWTPLVRRIMHTHIAKISRDSNAL